MNAHTWTHAHNEPTYTDQMAFTIHRDLYAAVFVCGPRAHLTHIHTCTHYTMCVAYVCSWEIWLHMNAHTCTHCVWTHIHRPIHNSPWGAHAARIQINTHTNTHILTSSPPSHIYTHVHTHTHTHTQIRFIFGNLICIYEYMCHT